MRRIRSIRASLRRTASLLLERFPLVKIMILSGEADRDLLELTGRFSDIPILPRSFSAEALHQVIRGVA